MKYNFEEDPITEVHRVRAELMEKYGGIEGWHKHNIEQHPQLEKEGWIFANETELKSK